MVNIILDSIDKLWVGDIMHVFQVKCQYPDCTFNDLYANGYYDLHTINEDTLKRKRKRDEDEDEYIVNQGPYAFRRQVVETFIVHAIIAHSNNYEIILYTGKEEESYTIKKYSSLNPCKLIVERN
jgi:hypothetical protein